MHGQLETPSGFTLMGSDAPAGMPRDAGSSIWSASAGRTRPARLLPEAVAGRLGDDAPREAGVGDEFGMLVDPFGVQWMVNVSQPAADLRQGPAARPRRRDGRRDLVDGSRAHQRCYGMIGSSEQLARTKAVISPTETVGPKRARASGPGSTISCRPAASSFGVKLWSLDPCRRSDRSCWAVPGAPIVSAAATPGVDRRRRPRRKISLLERACPVRNAVPRATAGPAKQGQTALGATVSRATGSDSGAAVLLGLGDAPHGGQQRLVGGVPALQGLAGRPGGGRGPRCRARPRPPRPGGPPAGRRRRGGARTRRCRP